MRPSAPLFGLLLAIAALPATADTFRLDRVHSRIAFIVDSSMWVRPDH